MNQTQDQRIAQRFSTVCSVELDQGTGLTLNLSTTGVYFTTQTAIQTGQPLRFSILLEKMGGLVSRLRCEGLVVRTDNLTEQFGVAVKFSNFGFEYVG